MSRDADPLSRLRLAAEVASGAMRDVALDLEEVADALPERHAVRRQQLSHVARRLQTAADLLTLEVSASSPATAGWVARIAKSALAAGAIGLAALPVGIGEGAGSALVNRALASQAKADECIEKVTREAAAADIADADEVVESSRTMLLQLINDPVFARDFQLPDRDAIVRMLQASDLGVPNTRQRVVYLQSVVDTLGALVYPVGGPGAMDDAVYRVERELARASAALDGRAE